MINMPLLLEVPPSGQSAFSVRKVPIKTGHENDEAESSFAKMSKRFSRSLKSLLANDGKENATSTSENSTGTTYGFKVDVLSASPLTYMRRAQSIGNLNRTKLNQ